MPKNIEKSLEIIGNGATKTRKLQEIIKVVSYLSEANEEIRKSEEADSPDNLNKIDELKKITRQLIQCDIFHNDALKYLKDGNYSRIQNIAITCIN